MKKAKKESLRHKGHNIFEHFEPKKAKISYPINIYLKDIYGRLDDHIRTIKSIYTINQVRKSMIENLLPGGVHVRTQDIISN